MRRLNRFNQLLAGFTLCITAGCHGVPRSDTNVAVVADYSVVVDTPLVKIDRGVTTITGTVRRQAGTGMEITGRVDIDFIAPDGDVLDSVTALFTPRRIPTDPAATSSYHIDYGYVPPKGSTVRVRFVDSATAERENVDGMNYGLAGGGNNHAGGGGYSQHQNTGHGGGGGGGGRGFGRTW